MSLTTELIIRIILVVSIIDLIVFYTINRNSAVITMPLAVSIIALTIIVLTINILFCLRRRGII